MEPLEDKAEVHYHEKGKKSWACGAVMGPATGHLESVTCEACRMSDACLHAMEEMLKREEEYIALHRPK